MARLGVYLPLYILYDRLIEGEEINRTGDSMGQLVRCLYLCWVLYGPWIRERKVCRRGIGFLLRVESLDQR